MNRSMQALMSLVVSAVTVQAIMFEPVKFKEPARTWPMHPKMKQFHESKFAATYREKMMAQVDEMMNAWYSNGKPYAKLSSLRRMLSKEKFKSCGSYFRIRDKQVHFIYQERDDWYTNLRTNLVALALQDTVDVFNLSSVKTELVINTCDHPISMTTSMSDDRGGYPLFVAHSAPYALDMPYPDPVDLVSRYVNVGPPSKTWEQRTSKAVFRGATNNYQLNGDYNWRASPRFRLQRLSEKNPDLIDARLTEWKSVAHKGAEQKMIDSIIQRMNKDGYDAHQDAKMPLVDLMDNYKYQLIVEGALGDGRLCGGMLSGALPVLQELSHTPYFHAALKNGSEILTTKRYFQDLTGLITWAKSHDDLAHDIAIRAHSVAAPLLCTWEGRLEYWALLLTEWNKAIDDTREIYAVERSEVKELSTSTSQVRWNETSQTDKWVDIWGQKFCTGTTCATGFDFKQLANGLWTSAESLRAQGAERPALLESLKKQIAPQ